MLATPVWLASDPVAVPVETRAIAGLSGTNGRGSCRPGCIAIRVVNGTAELVGLAAGLPRLSRSIGFGRFDNLRLRQGGFGQYAGKDRQQKSLCPHVSNLTC